MTFSINTESTIGDIVAVYNDIATYNGDKPVKKFKDRSTASSRLLAIADEAPKKILRKQTVIVNDEQVAAAPAPKTKTKTKTKSKSKSKSTAPAPKKSGPRTRLTGSTFTINTPRIPARPNSTLFHCFAFIAAAAKSQSDVTVGEVYAAYNKDADRQYRSNTDYMSSRTFKIAEAKGFLTISAPAEA